MAAAALARSFYHLLDRHRVDEAVGFLADDFRGHGMGSDRAGFGADAAAWLAAFPDLRISIDRLVTDGTSVAARLVLRGTHQGRFAGLSPTGRSIDIAGVDVLIEKNGRFVEAWSLRDLNGLWVQLGVLPYPSRSRADPRRTPTNKERNIMPKASKTTATDSMVIDGYEGHFENFEGGYTVGFETYTADADLTPLFAGLPDDRCQCAHWGYVAQGKVTFKTATGEETFEAGDAYYVGPGHTPILYAGTDVIEFSPTREFQHTLEVVEKNMAANG